MDWTEGKPTKAMWCLAAYLSNDEPPVARTTALWFNPHSTGEWWAGVPGQRESFTLRVTHWAHLPDPPCS